MATKTLFLHTVHHSNSFHLSLVSKYPICLDIHASLELSGSKGSMSLKNWQMSPRNIFVGVIMTPKVCSSIIH